MKMKISITTIAAEMGVSPTTVSRALNNSPKISDKRRREIKEFAKKNGFSLRPFAKRSTNICVLICTTSPDENIFSTYTDHVIAGATRYCSNAGLELSIFAQSHQRLNATDPIKELFRRGVNGVIVINAYDNSTFIRKFESEKLPYCCLISGNTEYPEHILGIENKTPAIQATEYLINVGHRNIAFICGDSHVQAHLDRLEGYKTAMEKAGLEALDVGTPAASGTESGFKTTRELLARHPKTTAIFAPSDELCDGIRAALYGMRLRIPEDISLIGCDNSIRAEYFAPPLTVIDTPNEKLGYTAAAWVHAQITDYDTPRPASESRAEGRLLIRETTAPPRT